VGQISKCMGSNTDSLNGNSSSNRKQTLLSSLMAMAALTLCVSVPNVVAAAPVIASVSSSNWSHGATYQITGFGFGVKTSPSPVVWDNGVASAPSDLWDGAWPSKSANAEFNLHYSGPMRGVAPPHSRDTKMLVGAHGENTSSYAGWDVIAFKRMTIASYPAYVYASWYQTADRNWQFGSDNNYKVFDYSTGSEPYASTNWYVAYGPPHPDNTSDTPQWIVNDDAHSLQNPDTNGNSFWWKKGKSPMGGWAKIEVATKLSPNADGYIKVWEDGALVVSYSGPTDKYPGNARTIGVGGFARMVGQPNNWRYFSDIYLDYTLARVVLADSASLANASIIEVQIPQIWADGQLSVKANLGKLSASQVVYLYVIDATGTVSNAMRIVTDSSSGALTSGSAKPRAPILK
jgi:hypothetical protein